MSCDEHVSVSRRQLLGGTAASLALWGLRPSIASAAAARDPRLLTIVLRGGLDGLGLLAPVGDPDYERLRGKLALARAGANAGLKAGDFFVLNPGMPFLHGLYQKREALLVHAVATPYRARSHFDGQDVLESGLSGVGRSDDGWLNRALAGLGTQGRADPKGLAIGAVVPLVMRGSAPVLSWSPKTYNLPLRDSTIARLMDLYGESDPKLAKALAEGLEIDRVAVSTTSASGTLSTPAAGSPGVGRATDGTTRHAPGQGGRPFREFVETSEAAARFLSATDGPRIGALAFDGWDTHANEGVVQGRLFNQLAGLDAAIKMFVDGMGAAWKETVVLIVTEFGRTAQVNGTEGTDHGTATTALVLGGGVNGGRVLADWPGLSQTRLHEGRDLAPTRDLRSLCKGVLRDHLGVPRDALSTKVFPGSAAIAPAEELLT